MTASVATIREYRDGDAAALRACIVELQESERRFDQRLRRGESMASAYLTHTLEQCRKHCGTILVADSSGVIAGFAVLLARVPNEELDDPEGDYAIVADLLVREPFRRRGIGVALLRACEDRAREAGADDFRVGVLSANEQARALYRRAGFTPYLETLAKRLR